jgi:hypothetical protein
MHKLTARKLNYEIMDIKKSEILEERKLSGHTGRSVLEHRAQINLIFAISETTPWGVLSANAIAQHSVRHLCAAAQ